MDFVREIRIKPESYYGICDAAKLIGISKEKLSSEFREGRLRLSRCGNHRLVRGQWLIDWIESATDAPTERQGVDRD